MKINASVVVLIGAISYGIPASLFKMAISSGTHPANLIIAQVSCAAIILALLNYFRRAKITFTMDHRSRGKLLLSGFAMACTNTLYFASLQYVSVTIAAVLLMQSVWITMVFGFIFKGNIPSKHQIIAVILIMVGTVLATQIFSQAATLSWFGILLAFGSAVAFAGMIMVTNSVVKEADPIQRAMYVATGASFFLILFWGYSVDLSGQWMLLKWGPIIAIFSAVLL